LDRSRLASTLSGYEEILLGVRGPLEESLPEYLTDSDLEANFGDRRLVTLTGELLQEARNREWWPWFVVAALFGLVAELGWLSSLRSRNEVSS
jgi:hypothetical protein